MPRFLLAGLILLATTPAAGHHSGAMYEPAKIVTITGVVTTLGWKNPHAQVDIVTQDAKAEHWAFECSTPNILARKGWTNSSVKAGDKVTITMRPMKDGSHEGLMLTMTTPKGAVLKDHDY